MEGRSAVARLTCKAGTATWPIAQRIASYQIGKLGESAVSPVGVARRSVSGLFLCQLLMAANYALESCQRSVPARPTVLKTAGGRTGTLGLHAPLAVVMRGRKAATVTLLMPSLAEKNARAFQSSRRHAPDFLFARRTVYGRNGSSGVAALRPAA